jgi:hypothetical protein
MGRPGITSVDVVRAYVALLRQGRVPGPQNLRLELSAGSYTTIAKHVNALALRHVALRPPRKRPRRTAQRWRKEGAGEREYAERSGYR